VAAGAGFKPTWQVDVVWFTGLPGYTALYALILNIAGRGRVDRVVQVAEARRGPGRDGGV